jgi:phosphatidylglycerol---prolipoprotein diacylglyceryl transferase
MFDPIAFELFGLEIRWYGILITFGMALGIAVVLHQVRKSGEKEDWFLDMALMAIPAGLLGARLYYVLFDLPNYDYTWRTALNFRQGGLAIHGGVLAGVIVGYFYTRYRKVSFFKWADLAMPGLILAQAIGRWGNFFNQEAYGYPTTLPWAMFIAGEYRHPTFLYESLWNLGVFALLLYVLRRKRFDGQIAALYLIGYSAGRFWIEALRTDSLMLGPIRVAQLISVVMAAAGVALYLYQGRASSVLNEATSSSPLPSENGAHPPAGQ